MLIRCDFQKCSLGGFILDNQEFHVIPEGKPELCGPVVLWRSYKVYHSPTCLYEKNMEKFIARN